MPSTLPFGELVEAVDQLPPDDQETLMQILHRRLAARRRKQLAADIEEARQEFARGDCRPTTPDELMREINS